MKKSGDLVIGRSGDRRTALGTRAVSDFFAEAMASIWKTLCSTIREVFDEAAYERFLSRSKGLRSIPTYREFLRERESVASRKPRCC